MAPRGRSFLKFNESITINWPIEEVFVPIKSDVDCVTLFGQPSSDEVGDAGFIFESQHTHRNLPKCLLNGTVQAED